MVKKISKGVYSSKWTERDLGDLVQVLINSDNVRQNILLDVDCTLHKGVYEQRLRGISNADIALQLAVKGFFGGMNTKKFTQYVSDNIGLFRFEKGIPKEEKGQYERFLIEMFGEILKGIPYVHLSKICMRMPDRSYPFAKDTIKEIEGSPVIVSKALLPVADAYKNYIGAIAAYGCRLEIEDRKIAGLGEDCIYTSKDKTNRALETIEYATRVITIGDTLEDYDMGMLGKDINDKSLIIAMHRRSEEFDEKADLAVDNWEDLYDVIQSHKQVYKLPKVFPVDGEKVLVR